ncbi:MAG TPA: hypothetical protein VKB96_03260 [Gammaproteobacteria bacterium]|nr:hypothetical protein [Gammaproteobacteria bacterium]
MVAACFAVSQAWVRWQKLRWHDRGRLAPLQRQAGRKSWLSIELRAQAQQTETKHLIFLDESGAQTYLTRRYGRAPMGVHWLK